MMMAAVDELTRGLDDEYADSHFQKSNAEMNVYTIRNDLTGLEAVDTLDDAHKMFKVVQSVMLKLTEAVLKWSKVRMEEQTDDICDLLRKIACAAHHADFVVCNVVANELDDPIQASLGCTQQKSL